MLAEKINNRPLAIILPGHSLRTFEKRIQEFKDFNWCWCTINYPVLANRILKKINKEIEVLVAMCNEVVDANWKFIEKFNGLIVGQNPRLKEHLHFTRATGNTLSVFLELCVERKIKKIYLFGADGYSGRRYAYYKHCKKIPGSNRYGEVQRKFHKKECGDLNNFFPYKFHSSIINVNPKSKYTVFNKISYDVLLGSNKQGV